MDIFLVITSTVFMVIGVTAFAAAAAATYYKRNENQRNIANYQLAVKQQAITDDRIAVLDNLAGEIRKLTGLGYVSQSDSYLVTVYDDDEHPEAYLFVLATIRNKLGGRCSYRDVVTELRAYNAAARAAGEEKLHLSEHRVRQIINQYTFAGENQWPIIVFKQAYKTGKRSQWDKEIERCVIVPSTTRGGYSKQMIALPDLLIRVGGKAARKYAANGHRSADDELASAW